MFKSFSERIGATTPKSIQADSMDQSLQISLWNVIVGIFDDERHRSLDWPTLGRVLAFNVLKSPSDEVPWHNIDARNWLKKQFFSLPWHGVYDAVEEAVSLCPDYVKEKLISAFNLVMEREMSAYRFISGELTPISNSTEVETIEAAIDQSKTAGLVGAQQHLKAALVLLGKKPEPDYRNAIKEAISAVESVVRQISGKDKAALGPALDELSKHVEIHPSFKEALKKLYGYTSDEGGIRHAILEEKEIGFDEAKFMIVACSAFVNFLISKADKAKLLE
jgi:hypothetical protein